MPYGKATRRLRKAQATIGLDLGDKRHTFCVLDTRGEIVNKGSMRNERNELAKLASAYPGALVVMEYTVVKKPNMTYSRSNCATAWCGRGWHWSIQCALP